MGGISAKVIKRLDTLEELYALPEVAEPAPMTEQDLLDEVLEAFRARAVSWRWHEAGGGWVCRVKNDYQPVAEIIAAMLEEYRADGGIICPLRAAEIDAALLEVARGNWIMTGSQVGASGEIKNRFPFPAWGNTDRASGQLSEYVTIAIDLLGAQTGQRRPQTLAELAIWLEGARQWADMWRAPDPGEEVENAE